MVVVCAVQMSDCFVAATEKYRVSNRICICYLSISCFNTISAIAFAIEIGLLESI